MASTSLLPRASMRASAAASRETSASNPAAKSSSAGANGARKAEKPGRALVIAHSIPVGVTVSIWCACWTGADDNAKPTIADVEPASLSGPRQKGLQAIDSLRPADLHALEMADAGLRHRDGAAVHRHRGLAVLFDERNRGQLFEQRLAGRVGRDAAEHQPLRRHELAYHALHRIDGPIRAPH